MRTARRGALSALLSACLRAAAPAVSLSLALAALSANTVFAQSPPAVSASASENEVEVGETFTVELKALSESGDAVTDPQLRPPAGFSVSGPMISTQSYMQFGAGVRKSMSGIGATWSLVASTPGSFTIPAPSVAWNGQRLRAVPLVIKVVPQGSKPRRPTGGFLFPGGGSGGSPFGPNWPFGGGGQTDSDSDESSDDTALSLSKAPFADVFLHASADKTRVVVGEQVTISVHRYFVRAAYADISDRTPMRLEDFLRYSLISDAGVQTTSTARAGDKRFFTRLIEKYAVFPLRAGALRTSSLLETYVPWSRRGSFRRASEDLVIQVGEPPIENRPVGYRIGDVGQFQASALVQPRRVEEGGSVAVTVKIAGTGNFPTSLPVPEKTGAEWLDPEKKEVIAPRNGDIAGYRTFGYVVRLTRKGTVDLGTIEFPYWNPRARRYEIARTALGAIDVTPSATPAPSTTTTAPAPDAANDDPFGKMPPPRTTLSAFARPPEGTLLQGPSFVAALAAPPLLALAGIAAASLARRARSRLADRKISPRTLAAAALTEAKRLKKAADERASAAAVERAIVLAIEAACGVKARGVLKETLAAELVAKGVAESTAQRAGDMLAACDKARFDPLAAADVHIDQAEALVSDLLEAKTP